VRYVVLSSLLAWLLGWLVAPALAATGEALYDQLITAQAQEHGLEPALVKAVIKCESSFNPSAQSPRGAQGLMQLMPSTQAMLGVLEPFDPRHNVAAGVRYLAMLKETFSGDLTLALAAYNAGPQTVIAAGYTVPQIAETQQYVRCVSTAYEHYRQHGLPTPLPGLRDQLPVTKTRRTLVVSPLLFSSQVAQVGQRLTVQIEARHTGNHAAHGIVMLNYPEHLVSFIALHTAEHETIVQLPASQTRRSALATPVTAAYQLLWRHWPAWAPGERRTAVVALVPLLPQDITLQLSVVLEETATPAVPQRWSTMVRIPPSPTTMADHRMR
jgi:Transglycosylase SLT domain